MGKPLFADEKTQEKLREQGKVSKADKGTEAKIWIGVPLKSDDQIIGIVSVQSYKDPDAFSREDMRLLEIVSDTLALAINRKKNVDALRENEKKYRLLYENTSLGLYRTTPAGKILMVNQAIVDMLGYNSKEELLQCELDEKHYPKRYNRKKFVEALEENGEIKGFESIWITKDGREKYVSENAKAFKDSEGNTIYYDGVAEDVTDLKRQDMIKDVLLKISHSASQISETRELIIKIREHLSELMETDNFGVAIYDEQDGFYSYPYYIDQNEVLEENYREFIPKSLTDYCRKKGKAILVDHYRMMELENEGLVEKIGHDSKVWLGVPLVTQNGTIGVLSVQSYENLNAYSKKDIEILDSVADTIAINIEKKQAELALQKSEERLSLALESANLGLWDLNTKTGKMYRSNIWAEMLGYNLDEIENDLDFFKKNVHPDDLSKLRYNISTSAEKINFQFDIEHRMRTKDGKWKWIRDWGKAVECDENGSPLRIVGTHLDIDEDKKLRLALKESEKRLSMALESTGLGMWDQDFTTGKVYRNSIWAEMLGYTLEEIENTSDFFVSLIHPDDLPEFEEQCRKAENGEDSKFAVEHRVKAKDGNWKWIYNWGRIVERNESGNPLRSIGTHLDITDLKETEQKLRLQQEHTKLINSILRHDIANAFSVIKSALNIFRRNQDEKMLDEANLQIKKGIALINKMKRLEEYFSLSRNLSYLRISEVLKEVVTSFIYMKISVKGDAEIMADDALSSVFDNLLTNASKHGNADEVEIEIEQIDDQCQITVKDNGKGISEEIKSKIFDEAFKAGDTGNTGLGLYIVKKTIERYEGKIRVEDNKPQGAKFIIELKCR